MDVTFEIVQKLGVLSETEKGWTKELNIVSWNNAAPKFDIRSWDANVRIVRTGSEKMAVIGAGSL